MVRATLHRLVAFPPGAPAVRRKRRAEELTATDDGPSGVSDLIGAMTESRLLVVDQEGIEFAHDAVLIAWPRLREWVVTARADEEARQRVESAAADWSAAERSAGHLATAGMVEEVTPLVDSGRLLLTRTEREFLRESSHRLRRARQRRWMAGATAVVAAVAVGLVGVLWRRTGDQADRNREAVARQLAEQSIRTVSDRPDLALRLATTAHARSEHPAVRSALATTLTQPAPLVGMWSPADDRITAAAVAPGGYEVLIGTGGGELLACDSLARQCAARPESPLTAAPAAITEAGSSIAVVLADGTLLAGPAEGQLNAVSSNEPVRLAALDPEGQLVVSATQGGAVEVRNLGGNSYRIGEVTGGAPSAVAVSARRELALGAGSERFGFTLWNIEDGTVVADVASSDVVGTVYAATFDRSGDRLLVGGGPTGDIFVWSVDALVDGTGERPLRLQGGDRAVVRLAVTGEGQDDQVVSVDESGVVRQYRLSSGRQVGAPMLALSPLGEPPAEMVVAGARDSDQRIVGVRSDGVLEWDALGRSGLNQGRATIDGLAAIAAAPEHELFYAIAADGAVHTLDTDGDMIATFDGSVTEPTSAVVLAPDRLAIGGRGLVVTDARTGARSAERADLDVVALATAGGSGSETLAAATSDGAVLVLDAADLSTTAGPFPTTADRITDLALSPDGTTVAVGTTGGGTKDALTIDVDSAEIRPLEGHGAEVSGVAFSPDGEVLATGSDDRSIILWSTTDWTRVAVLSGHEDRVRQLAFTKDGGMLLSVSDDGTMRWWDVEAKGSVGLPLRHEGQRLVDVQVTADAAVTRDGRTAVSTWRTDTAGWVAIACAISSRPLTGVEHESFLSGGVEAPCPA
jgi:WD40 repeat protein